MLQDFSEPVGKGRFPAKSRLKRTSLSPQVSVPIVSNDKCKSMFLRAGRHEFIPEIFLCAGYENGGQDSCQVRETECSSGKR